jgi:hypothetical protein
MRNPAGMGGIVEICSAHGKIAVYFTESEAWDLYYLLHSDDMFRAELQAAILRAYPSPEGEA